MFKKQTKDKQGQDNGETHFFFLGGGGEYKFWHDASP